MQREVNTESSQVPEHSSVYREENQAFVASSTPEHSSLQKAATVPAQTTQVSESHISLNEKNLAQLWSTPKGKIKLMVLSLSSFVVLAAVIILVARGITTLPGVPAFLERYPGEYRLPVHSDPGFPLWVRWSHFLNIFMMVLIIKTGWQIRHQKKPPAYWTAKKSGNKISLTIWLHTALDLLWITNGIIFIIVLFLSGHWVRIVPTSMEVFPNAVSALLQYLTLEWPIENGWVNYNSLQQLMYFTVVFIAAPLAAISGIRMSIWWPKNATRLNQIYPLQVARNIHFPTMLFFVFFITVHVLLVLSTGALRNLNHMFAGTDTVNWAGFWWFTIGLSVTTALAVLSKPALFAPIANRFGKVTTR